MTTPDNTPIPYKLTRMTHEISIGNDAREIECHTYRGSDLGAIRRAHKVVNQYRGPLPASAFLYRVDDTGQRAAVAMRSMRLQSAAVQP